MLAPLAAFGIMTAAVIWAKLRLVGDVPRTAYAVPDAPADTERRAD